MSEHHEIIAKALRFTEQADDAAGFDSVRKAFLCTDAIGRRAVLEGVRREIGDCASASRKTAQVWNFLRSLQRDHEALIHAGR